MTEPERDKNLEPAQASSSEMNSPDDDATETPMLAVWLSLGAILIAGLYGLYLGGAAKSNAKSNAKATSSIVVPYEAHGASVRGRPS